jgi:hypothetical protein
MASDISITAAKLRSIELDARGTLADIAAKKAAIAAEVKAAREIAAMTAEEALKEFAKVNTETFVESYTKTDGTSVRGYIKAPVTVSHKVYGKGKVSAIDLKSGAPFIPFAVMGSGKNGGKVFMVGKSAISTVS